MQVINQWFFSPKKPGDYNHSLLKFIDLFLHHIFRVYPTVD